MWVVNAYMELGLPFAHVFGGFMDRRGDIREGRERWIDRYAPDLRSALWELWTCIDAWHLEREAERAKAAEEEAKSRRKG